MTLTRTTLAHAAGLTDTVLYLTTATSVVKGSGICVDRELCQATAAGRSDGSVPVIRGISGWQTAHASGIPATVGGITCFHITREGVTFNPVSGLPPQASWIDMFGTTPSLAVSVRAQESDQNLSAVLPVGTD